MKQDFILFLIGSYAFGWVLNGFCAKVDGFLDLCQFVRSFILAPFILLIITGFIGGVVLFVVSQIIPYWDKYLEGIVFLLGAVMLAILTGKYAVAPAIKKAYGIAAPFSSKICIVLYKK